MQLISFYKNCACMGDQNNMMYLIASFKMHIPIVSATGVLV